MTESANFLLPVLKYFLNTLVLTLKIILGSFFPVVFACFVLNLLAKEQNRRLYQIGGWNALMTTAWIGTPVHELSHFLATVIANHKIVDLQLFKPNKRTGTLGYVSHSYQSDSFYQATFGNAIVSIAPFFGGALAIYLLSSFLFPDFSLFSDAVPKIKYFPIDKIAEQGSLSAFFRSHLDFFGYLIHVFFSQPMLHSWKLYVFLFIMFGIANHLSPSGPDFDNFWQPLAFFLFGIFLLNLAIYPLIKNPGHLMGTISDYLFFFMPILYLAIFVSLIWLAITYVTYGVISLFRRG
ncbi:MAG: hypothetical protein GXO74_15805 [Calditrichaeota bacterium]|nr:hypothetical protein [Calditrichota bacterium]